MRKITGGPGTFRRDGHLFKKIKELDVRGRQALRGANREQINADPAPDGGVQAPSAHLWRKTAELTASKIEGTSSRTVERVRTILDHASQETLLELESGVIPIAEAYERSMARRRDFQTLERLDDTVQVSLTTTLVSFIKGRIVNSVYHRLRDRSELEIVHRFVDFLWNSKYIDDNDNRLLRRALEERVKTFC